MNPAIAGARAAERVRSTERIGSVERLRLHGVGLRAHGDRPASRHVALHFAQMAFRASESPTLFSGADRFVDLCPIFAHALQEPSIGTIGQYFLGAGHGCPKRADFRADAPR
jgi:hypothetical protein